jgi:hypothetical protein
LKQERKAARQATATTTILTPAARGTPKGRPSPKPAAAAAAAAAGAAAAEEKEPSVPVLQQHPPAANGHPDADSDDRHGQLAQHSGALVGGITDKDAVAVAEEEEEEEEEKKEKKKPTTVSPPLSEVECPDLQPQPQPPLLLLPVKVKAAAAGDGDAPVVVGAAGCALCHRSLSGCCWCGGITPPTTTTQLTHTTSNMSSR